MSRLTQIAHRFVETVPKELEDGVLYISIPYTTAVHRCACGCGNRVVTPIRPKKWHLTFNGEAVSLDPSVGNWSFPCQSHYWIESDRILWAGQMSKEKIERLRTREGRRRGTRALEGPRAAPEPAVEAFVEPTSQSLLKRIRIRWRRKPSG